MKKTLLSFEFFPPKTPEGLVQLHETAKQLSLLAPQYFSVTYGAGGSTQDNTLETVLEVRNKTSIEATPHLSCISATKAQAKKQLLNYQTHGIRQLVALRGDLPSGTGSYLGDFHYASDLVAFIRNETGNHFKIQVAVYPEYHPECLHPQQSLEHFHQKVSAGADGAITQYFYNADAYFHLMDNCEKLNISIPIVPGIMPITNYKQLLRFSTLCGAEIPRWIKLKLESYGEDLESIRKFGEDTVSKLCEKLLANGAPGLHFYTLNRAQPTLAILKSIPC